MLGRGAAVRRSGVLLLALLLYSGLGLRLCSLLSSLGGEGEEGISESEIRSALSLRS